MKRTLPSELGYSGIVFVYSLLVFCIWYWVF
jgi:hypothetical protein